MAGTPSSGRQAAASWELVTREGRIVVRLAGEIDLAAVDGLSAGLLNALADHVTPGSIVECDLNEVAYMDSTGFHMLVKLQSAVEDETARLLLVRPSTQVRQILDIAGGDLFRIID